jgi:UDP-2,3-diacylglucosamine pyrophosphatase LpxH
MNSHNSERRPVEVVVISDVHLGTFGCRASELLQYLRSIQPETLVLNGDIVDFWQFKKKYWPVEHTKVLKEILHLASNGTTVRYITGNHDETLRRFAGQEIGNISIDNKCVLNLDGKKAWIFHGDVFDVTMQHSKILTRLGSVGYDVLIQLNASTNKILESIGRERISFSKKVKNGVKKAVSFINKFEDTCAQIAIREGYDFVICGHIHQPEIKIMSGENGKTMYLNSGDWIENLTALEYNNQCWDIMFYEDRVAELAHGDGYVSNDPGPQELFEQLLSEFNVVPAES